MAYGVSWSVLWKSSRNRAGFTRGEEKSGFSGVGPDGPLEQNSQPFLALSSSSKLVTSFSLFSHRIVTIAAYRRFSQFSFSHLKVVASSRTLPNCKEQIW